MNRRNFFLTSASLGVSSAIIGTVPENAHAEKIDKVSDAKLRLACYWGNFIPAENDDQRIKKMLAWGFQGVEISGNGNSTKGDLKKRLDDAGLEICSLCFGSCGGKIVSEDVSRRQSGIDELKKALENAGILGAKCVVYVPAFNRQTKLEHLEIRKVLINTLPDLAKFAAQHHTNIVLEPLNRGEAWFLRTIADAAAIARECEKDHGGIGVLGDFYHMTTEETSDMGAFLSGGSRLMHVHLGNGPQPPRRTLPGQDDRLFVDGFRGLKFLGYNRFCSFECGVHGDKEIEIPKSIAFLKSEWEKAEI
ncbi:MAG: sugar phosphate isomerase/epimerase family protein [Planctomycetia bacterium]|nr:sugar phosphate isomerase/epimerase family protein [Planctomycetia bacterium]